MPPQLLGAHLRLGFKILRGHIVHIDLCFVPPQIVSPRLQTMFYDKNSLSWVVRLLWQPSSFMLPYALALVCTSKGLLKSVNLSMGGNDDLLLSFPKTRWQSSSHSWDSHIFQQVEQGQTTIDLRALMYNGHPCCINIRQWQSPLTPYAPQNVFKNLIIWAHLTKKTCS